MTDLSKKVQYKRERRQRAHRRVRTRIAGTGERPRLAVFKSLRYVYAQVIDDQAGRTLAAASSREPALRETLEGSASGKSAARLVGEKLAERARAKGIERVVFDRAGYIYHGKVKELAEAAREGGLEF